MVQGNNYLSDMQFDLTSSFYKYQERFKGNTKIVRKYEGLSYLEATPLSHVQPDSLSEKPQEIPWKAIVEVLDFVVKIQVLHQ